jgi:fatty-acyl-CoA synthase|tara:strand:- start:576 stop:2393 length:1818 start_codon:yes stop_codon:yes gene_type:complete
VTLVATDLTTVEAIEAISNREFADFPPQSTYDIFRLAAQRRPDAPALTFLSDAGADTATTTYTAKHLFERITQTANLFFRLGVREGDVVAIMLPILPESYYSLWGAQAAGVALPLNPMLGIDQLTPMLAAAKAKVLVTCGPSEDLEIWGKAQLLRSSVPSLETVLRVNRTAQDGTASRSFLRSLDAQQKESLKSGRIIRRQDIAAYFHTGGTTGTPRLARLSHGNQVFTAWGCRWMFDFCEGDKILNGFPVFHVAGPLDFFLSPISAGMEVVLPTPLGMRNPDIVCNHWKLVEKLKLNFLTGVPTSIAAVNAVAQDGADLSSAKCWITGGSPLPVELAADFEDRFNIPIREVYGMTETSAIGAITPRHGNRKPGAAGLAAPLCEITVVSSNSGSNRGLGGVLMRGPHTFLGYTDSRLTDEVISDDGWLVTGDLGYMDDEGYLFLTGRSKEVIIRGGHNIDPSVIETAALTHSDVSYCAAVGQPDAYAGETPVLFVAPKPGRVIGVEEMRNFVSVHIGEPQARPKKVYVLDQMPLTVVGKVSKPALRLMAANSVFADVLKDVRGIKLETAFDAKKGMVLRISGAMESDKTSIDNQLAPFNISCEFC